MNWQNKKMGFRHAALIGSAVLVLAGGAAKAGFGQIERGPGGSVLPPEVQIRWNAAVPMTAWVAKNGQSPTATLPVVTPALEWGFETPWAAVPNVIKSTFLRTFAPPVSLSEAYSGETKSPHPPLFTGSETTQGTIFASLLMAITLLSCVRLGLGIGRKRGF